MKALVVTLALLLPPALAAADEFSDWRIPAHSWQSGSGSFYASGRHSYYSPPSGGWTRAGSAEGSTNLRLERGYDSDRLQHGWRFALSGGGNALREESRDAPMPGSGVDEHEYRSQSTHEELELAPWARFYPAAVPIGLEAAGSLRGGWVQGWNRIDHVWEEPAVPRVTRARDSEQLHRYDYRLLLQVSVGLGLVRDATVVEDVHVLESRLLASGALVRALSTDARRRLAGILAVAPHLFNAHDRPDRFEWREIERVLREDGALRGEALDAYSLTRARESYAFRSSSGRLRGQFIGLTLEQEHSRDIDRRDTQIAWRSFVADTLYEDTRTSLATRTSVDRDVVRAGARAEWHLPIGWRWQCSLTHGSSMPVRAAEHGLRSATALLLTCHVADRWEVQGRVNHTREYVRVGTTPPYGRFDDWSAGSTIRLDYWLEDRIKLSASLNHYQGRRAYDALAGAYYARETRLGFGLTYRFLGRVSAPGLFEPMALLR